MRYFHRTSTPADQVLAEADRYFAGLVTDIAEVRRRRYRGPNGQVDVSVRAEGGHYTLITVDTDQVGESEVDKLAKRFLSIVHRHTHPAHSVRGAY